MTQQRNTPQRPAPRTFTDAPAVRAGVSVPLLLGIVGATGSGKTFSALRLATGMARVLGLEVWFIDTEGRRGLHYADHFKFRYVQFDPPFGPLDYLAALEHCYNRGGRIIVVDSMTHEHAGPGGVMDQAEDFIQAQIARHPNKAEYDVRNTYQMMSLIRPKQQRKKLNAAIVQMGINAVFCYRATEKIKPVPGAQPANLGWQPETTSTLHYEMTQRFLLTPGCDGVPALFPQTDEERRMVKNPAQFRGWFAPAAQNGPAPQLNEDMGARMAQWARGENPGPPPGSAAEAAQRQRQQQRPPASTPATPSKPSPQAANDTTPSKPSQPSRPGTNDATPKPTTTPPPKKGTGPQGEHLFGVDDPNEEPPPANLDALKH